MRTLDGKTALITGAARGMGAAHARLMVDEGARVVLGDVLDDEGAATATGLGADLARYVHLDVADPDGWQAAVDAAVSAFGSLDVLVNNAGIVGGFGPFESTDLATFRKVLDVNVVGTFLGIRAAVPAMRRAGGGSIVNVSSSVGMLGQGYVPAYVASKWAIRGLTKSAALELSREGIRVNSVHPGLTITPMTEASDKEAESATQPIARPAAAVEISHMVVFLASDRSSYATGAEFVVDGGATAGFAGRPAQ